MNRKTIIASRFGRQATTYDAQAGLQARVAADLACHLPTPRQLVKPKILEFGCGTGLFTEHLLGSYPDGHFFITDLSEDMLKICRQRIGYHDRMTYLCCDAERLKVHPQISNHKFDVIASNMTVQWFENPFESLLTLSSLLTDDGILLYSSLAPDSFPEWSLSHEKTGMPSGLLQVPELPGLFKKQKIRIDYKSAWGFLSMLKSLGASTAREGYKALPASKLRQVMREFEQTYQAHATWHIAYGKLPFTS